MKCKHCGKGVIFTGHTAQGYDTDYVHDNLIRRCRPEESGKPYGLEADVDLPERNNGETSFDGIYSSHMEPDDFYTGAN